MPIVERYILRRIAATFCLVLATLIATVWLTQVLRELDVITTKGQTLSLFLGMTLLAIPSIVQMIAPFAFMVGALATLNAMHADSETTILSASGASRRWLARPVLVAALAVSLLVMTFQNVLSPFGLNMLRVLITQVRTDLVSTLVKDGEFHAIEDGLTLHIREKAADGSFEDIFVSDDRDPAESLQYTAKRGMLVGPPEASYLVMRDGHMIRKQREGGGINIVHFGAYAFDLSHFRQWEPVTFYKPRERMTSYLLAPDPEDVFYKEFPQRFAAELHERLSAPLYPLAFALVILAWAASPRTNRQERGFALAAPALVCIGLRAGGFFVFGIADKSAAAVPFLYLLPVAAVALSLAAILFDVKLRMPRLLEGLVDAGAGLARRALARARGPLAEAAR